MKKLISLTLCILLMFSFSACGTDATDAAKVFSPDEYGALYDKYAASPFISIMLSQSWTDPNNVDADCFINYYADSILRSGGSFELAEDYGMYIAAAELETMVQSHFNVSVEHLRTALYFIEEKNAYEFGGLGGATDCEVTSAEQNGKLLIIGYKYIHPMGYVSANGKLTVEDGGGNFKYLANEIEWSVQYHMDFPSAMNETDQYGVFMMDSGGKCSTSSDGVNWRHYNGEDITSIIAYYENEALPALEAAGEADTSKYADGWYWSGTYRSGKPLAIDVQRKYGADSYIITALYGEKSNPDIANNIRSREFMQSPNLHCFPELNTAYLWRLCKAGVLDTSWDIAENVDVPGLVRLYAIDAVLADKSVKDSTAFPATDVESFIQKRFDISTDIMRGWNVYDRDKNMYAYTPLDNPAVCKIVSATSYGSEDGNPTRIVLAYEVMRSEDDNTVIWSGELTVELSDKGYKYISNNKYFPEYPITQDAAYLDDITKKYVRPLVPYGSILVHSWPNAKDISADNLVDFCAFNNLVNLPLDENNEYMAGQQNASAEQAETAIRQYFDVSAEYLRTSSRYNHADGYVMLNGGGGGMTRALHAEQDGDLLKITVGLYGPDDEMPARPAKTGLLTVRLDGDRFQYLSYALEK